MNAFAGIRPKGGQSPTPLSFFPWRLQWGLSVFQWGSNPHNPPPIFTLVHTRLVSGKVEALVTRLLPSPLLSKMDSSRTYRLAPSFWT